ncbi:hydroxymethylglutaryl-CoA synthase [Arthroderma uncinatum]|uniref:hydroxymethylglutaryl-CoA synthase n=1 Tax=Arthroderma uncinatum TaxID=74035 RepID=UPI00144AF416|nr:hydroxymethylglutaryl-CoA synthase [Arthroderma uncinatum]KAF3491557.1 hydroxymethylglutaryl-CoA synthase [Arthroderma uncinatum]
MSSRPQNIGIKAMEIYFPSQCVDQKELEKFDGVSEGKYTIGLGQTKMSFCDDREVDACYKAYNAREKVLKAQNGDSNGIVAETDTPIDRFDHILFHAPTCKLVAKSYGRMLYNDYLAHPEHPSFAEVAPEVRTVDYEKSVTDKTIEKTFMALSKKRFNSRVLPSIEVATQCGNMYCASVYGGLVSLLSNVTFSASQPKRVGIFSYGSGLASSMFSVKIVGDVSNIVKQLDLAKRLDARRVVEPQVFDDMCQLREKAHLQKNFTPVGSTDTLTSGTYYLTKVDDMFRREYEVKA